MFVFVLMFRSITHSYSCCDLIFLQKNHPALNTVEEKKEAVNLRQRINMRLIPRRLWILTILARLGAVFHLTEKLQSPELLKSEKTTHEHVAAAVCLRSETMSSLFHLKRKLKNKAWAMSMSLPQSVTTLRRKLLFSEVTRLSRVTTVFA